MLSYRFADCFVMTSFHAKSLMPFQFAMVFMIVACFLFSMGNKPKVLVGRFSSDTGKNLTLILQYRSQWKYTSAAIFFGLAMIYLIFASVKCAVLAASQGGSANSIMLFSIVIIYGCE